ncbi:anti-sigma factor [Flavobacterium sp.]|uniref:anti-sigma factor n=1 Tax=Flavobacterium sp. TaxID=239 RepID=UPI0026373A83|nr:anti-sigma factor [Flavobacterium sp.]
MEKKHDTLEDVFKKLEHQWDIEDLDENHYDRFIAKRAAKKSKKKYWYSLSVAASIVVLIGCFTFLNHKNEPAKNLSLASRETQQTDSIFSCMIKMELDKIKEKKSPVNEKIIADAMAQMRILDADYEKIKQELHKNGENKQIIFAMIRNLKTRISFLENVLDQINNTEKLITITDEKTI